MRLLVTSEGHYWQHPGRVVIVEGVADYGLLCRYLDVFDEVVVAGRMEYSSDPAPNGNRADGPGIHFHALPGYRGPRGYLKAWQRMHKVTAEAVASTDACIIRTPGAVGFAVWKWWRRTGRPFGVEVVGDPYDVFAPGSVSHPLRPFLRWWFPRQMWRQCAGACAAAYVTERTLQRRYPPAPDAFSTHYSSIVLPDAALVSAPRSPRSEQRRFSLIIVGTLAQLYKAPDVLIDAVAACVREELDLQLVVVGDGKHRQELEAQAAALGLDGRVRFLGRLPPGEAVRAQLDQADLFILPSHQEGLPRAMIEAMARALPCLGSTAGGIPELLLPENMVPPGDVTGLARKIREVVTDPACLARMSARNLEKAKEYREKVIRERRITFYRYVQERTEAWLETQE